MDTTAIILVIIVIAAACLTSVGAAHARRRQRKKMQEDIYLGDDVETIGGIHGVVVSFTEEEVTIESGSKGSEVAVLRGAITAVSHKTATR